jgi:DNA-directed RNA polymerase specialized sigma24 family protein
MAGFSFGKLDFAGGLEPAAPVGVFGRDFAPRRVTLQDGIPRSAVRTRLPGGVMTTPTSPQPPDRNPHTESWLYDKGPRGNPQRFVERYYVLIEDWASRLLRRSGTSLDFRDVAQEVVANLLSREAWSFQRDRGQFRGFLYRIVQNAVVQKLRERQRQARHGDCAAGGDADFLQAVPDPGWDELTDRIDSQWQQDSRLIQHAVKRVRARVSSMTWDAFYLNVVQGVRSSEVAQRLDLGKPSKVYDARLRVVRLLLAELAGLGLDGEDLNRHLAAALQQTQLPSPTTPPEASLSP